MTTRTRLLSLALSALLIAATAGCSAQATAVSTAPASAVRLGYLDNVTHGPALVGIEHGILQKALGRTTLRTQVFTAGPAEIEALSAGAIDAAYIGPTPAINSYLKSAGASLKIVAGATVGGAALVVKPGITSASQLKGTTLATPQLGNTQDVALRSWLAAKGLRTDPAGGGDVSITPTDNAQAFTLFQSGSIDGAWVPEPWVSRFVLSAGASVLVDEATLWPHGRFPTTVLAVSAAFLAAHPSTVRALVQGNTAAIAFLTTDTSAAATAINDKLAADTGKPLAADVLTRALAHVTFDDDPDAKAFPTLVKNAVTAGTGKKGSLAGLFDLTALNAVRAARGASPVSAAGLGTGHR